MRWRHGTPARRPSSGARPSPYLGHVMVRQFTFSRLHNHDRGVMGLARGCNTRHSQGWRRHLLPDRERPENMELVVAVLAFHGDQQQAAKQELLPALLRFICVGFVRPASGAFHPFTPFLLKRDLAALARLSVDFDQNQLFSPSDRWIERKYTGREVLVVSTHKRVRRVTWRRGQVKIMPDMGIQG